MIVYGWNNYCLKKVSLSEIGIYSKDQPDITFEYRQKYFHLFFIPFFPLGRFWAVRQDGKMYEPSAEMHESLQAARQTGKKGLWAWSGPLAIIAGLLLFNVADKLQQQAYAKRMAAHASLLTDFFKDKNKIAPLSDKLVTMEYLVDSSLNSDDYKAKRVDTTEDGLIKLYLEAQLTQTDSLTGYNEKNTLVGSRFHDRTNKPQVVSENCKSSLQSGAWTSAYGDTASVFGDMRKLENYRYILIVKEYNRVSPVVQEDGYLPGYSFANATIMDAATGAIKKRFKLMATNSETVSTFSGSSSVSKENWRMRLENDLRDNMLKAAGKYVFGEK